MKLVRTLVFLPPSGSERGSGRSELKGPYEGRFCRVRSSNSASQGGMAPNLGQYRKGNMRAPGTQPPRVVCRRFHAPRTVKCPLKTTFRLTLPQVIIFLGFRSDMPGKQMRFLHPKGTNQAGTVNILRPKVVDRTGLDSREGSILRSMDRKCSGSRGRRRCTRPHFFDPRVWSCPLNHALVGWY